MPSAQDLLALGDAELAQLVDKHCNPDEDWIEISVDGLDKLSSDEKKQLAERLKAAQNLPYSRPLDLDQLDARLREVDNTSGQDRPRIVETSRSPTASYDWEAECRYEETEAYNKLVAGSGRPLYSIGLLEQVSTNPQEYHEMLQSWQYPADTNRTWEVFQRQWGRWRDFRRWQLDNRGLEEDDDGGFPAFVERQKSWLECQYTENGYIRLLAEIEADPSYFDPAWKRAQDLRRWMRQHCREHGCDGFPDYAEAARQRLTRHGFTRPFQLGEDPRQQDSLTTWIEYTNFEYWRLDNCIKSAERLKTERDKAWQELVDSNMTMPHETIENVATDAVAMQQEHELQAANEALKEAESKVKSICTLAQSDTGRQDIVQIPREKMLREATAELTAAKEQKDQTYTRMVRMIDFVRESCPYRSTRRDIVNQEKRMQWILEQIPLIEAEMTQSETADAGSDATKRREGRLASAEDRSPERQKQDCLGLGQLSDNGAAEAHKRVDFAVDDDRPTSRGEAQGPRTTRQSPDRPSHRFMDASRTMGPSPPPPPRQGLRRSARIAALQKKNPPAVAAPPPPRKQPRPKPRAKAGKVTAGPQPQTTRVTKIPQARHASTIRQGLRRSSRVAAEQDPADTTASPPRDV